MANVILLQKGDLKSSDFTNDNSNNKEGIGIRVSPDNGNLLQQRKNGLYYGIEAPPDTANLYVSSSMGDDSNAGTRAAPLKTIREAITRNYIGTTFTINLFEDDVHPVHASWGPIGNGKLFAMQPYGPVTDEVRSRNPRGTGSLWYSQELRRPTVKFVYDGQVNVSNKLYERNNLAQYSAPATGQFRFYGIRFDQTGEFDLPVGNIYNITPFGWDTYGVSITFFGCDFITRDGAALVGVGDTATLYFRGSVIDSSNGGHLIILSAGGNLNVVVDNVGRVAGPPILTPPEGKEPLTFRATSPESAYTGMITSSVGVTVSSATTTNANIKTSFTNFF